MIVSAMQCVTVRTSFIANALFYCFFFNDTATTEIYTLSLHDALPIWVFYADSTFLQIFSFPLLQGNRRTALSRPDGLDRKSTRLNSSHANISYAVFCLKKKKYFNSNF